MKYWMISGLLLDFSSTSVNTSSTSAADSEKTARQSRGKRRSVRQQGESAPPLPHPSTPPPSTASPRDIFFRYMVMSAPLSDTEAEMFTRGRELEDRSSGGKSGERGSCERFLAPTRDHELCSLLVDGCFRGLPSLSSGATSAEELFTGRVSPARSDFSCTRSGFSAQRTLEGKTETKRTSGSSLTTAWREGAGTWGGNLLQDVGVLL